MHKYLNQFLGLAYLFFVKLNWRKAIKLHSKKAELVVWIWPNFPRQPFEYFGRSIITNEITNLIAVVNAGIPYRLLIGRKVGKIKDSKIIYQVSHEFLNIFKFIHYPPFLIGVAKAMESQNNTIFLSSKEVAYWENKDYMQKMFSKLDISHPKTFVCESATLASFSSLNYPYIIKEVNSQGSKGLHKIENQQMLSEVAADLQARGEATVIAQQIVKMTRDIRVTIVGGEVVLAYWRINHEKEWRPTSTSRGSSVDFGNFPEKWRSYFIDITNRMELSSAAYDVCWENDDVETQPMILEVSPSFQPNPPLPAHLANIPYKDYKKIFFTKQPFFKERINILITIANKKLAHYIASGKINGKK